MRTVQVRTHVRRRVRLRGKQPRIPAFHVITAGEPFGELLAHEERIDSACERGMLFGADELLGDGQFVFLSVHAPAPGRFGTAGTCFVFDAEELIRRGALVRLEDIFMTREYNTFNGEVQRFQSRLVNEYRNLLEKDDKTFGEKRRLEELSDVLGEEEGELELGTDEMSKEQLRRFSELDFGVREALQALRQKRDEITLSGDEALEALQRCSRQRGLTCEILVPKRLSLLLARKAGPKGEVAPL